MAVCLWFDEVPLYVEGRLDVERVTGFEAHIGNCPQCQAELRRLTGDDPLESASSVGRPTEIPSGDDPFSHPDYQILDELGRGSSAIVYLARDFIRGRLVAVKLPHPGHPRLMAEMTAVEMLKHPHIVTLYETGQRNGRPFLVMEYAHGNSLAHFVEELRRKKREENPSLEYVMWEPRHAVELLRPVADAVAAVHRKGILHRDLKPGNILLCVASSGGAEPLRDGDAAGFIPKVTDFGLAKFFQGEGPQGDTRLGDLLGTPSYVSPEQALGKKNLGPPTDVYSLGVILYRLLTGRTPFVNISYVNNLIAVVQEDPVPPTRIAPTIPRDLSIICLKCLEKNPAHRYADAGALAKDLSQFLRGEPITARAPGTFRQLKKWGRRHPNLAAGAALLLALALVGTPVFSVLYLRAESQRERGDHFATLSLKALEKPAEDIAEKSLHRIGKSGLLDHERDLLEAVAPLYQLFLERAGGDPAALASKGNVYNKLAVIRRALGNLEGALSACLEAEAVFLRLGPEHRFGLATALSHKTAVLGSMGRRQDALAAAVQAEPLLEELAGAGRADVRFRLAICQNNRALCHRLLGDVPAACAAFDTAVKNLSSLIEVPKDRQDSRMPIFREWRIRILNNKGEALLHAQMGDEVAVPLEEAAKQAEVLVNDEPHAPNGRDALAACLVNLAALRMKQGNFHEAEVLSTRYRKVYASLLAQFPRAQEYLWGVELATLAIAKAKLSQKGMEHVAAGLEEARKAIVGYESLVKKYPLEVTIAKERGDAYAILAQALLIQKKPTEAEPLAETCLGIFQALSRKHGGMEFAQMESEARALLDSIRAAKKVP